MDVGQDSTLLKMEERIQYKKHIEKVELLKSEDRTISRHEMIPHSEKGLSVFTASLFISGIVVGGGTVAIPSGLADTGWIGVALMLFSALGNAYASQVLIKCLNIMEEKEERYRTHLRDPYTAIVNYALGNKWKIAAIVCFHIMSILVCVIYLLIAAELSSQLLNSFFPLLANPNEFRIFVAIFAVCLIPLTLLGTPKEFWGIALIAVLTTAISCFLILGKLLIDSSLHHRFVEPREVTWETFFQGTGVIFFAFCGAPFFPALQTDMKKRTDFHKAIGLGYLTIFSLYVPVSVAGVVLLGDKVKSNILENIKMAVPDCSGCMALVYITQILLCLHFVFAYTLILNPILQEIEELCSIPKGESNSGNFTLLL